jgi:hypothetical protein
MEAQKKYISQFPFCRNTQANWVKKTGMWEKPGREEMGKSELFNCCGQWMWGHET